MIEVYNEKLLNFYLWLFLLVEWWWEATCCLGSFILKSTCNSVSILIILSTWHFFLCVACIFIFTTFQTKMICLCGLKLF